ncbi:glyoxysomal processing protease, glyoxysomal-like isoform X2 [Mangifera indica]|uniref:glyoxysomal processing protease, glyoxysomal-like isoform X2 n=1 Tax=Mangifera indica TaxID=29780 RepID=UPI001CFA515C|nr:glyoxysomal processing protease, glyoxysomal-like isoform X2 [Mangifera indica]
MGFSEMAEFSRNFGVLVRVQGPDPKGLKMRNHAFHQFNSGKTTLSASGMLLPNNIYHVDVAERNWGVRGLVVTAASVVEPFLTMQQREQNVFEGRPELILGAQVDVMLEGTLGLEIEHEGLHKGVTGWVSAQVIMLVDIPVSSLALRSLIEASSGSPEHRWEIGWSLASHDNGSQPLMDVIITQVEHDSKPLDESLRHLPLEESSDQSLLGKSTTRIAILGVSSYLKDLPNIAILPSSKRGNFLLAVGSPFGVLSPMHFFNSISMGTVANCYPPGSSMQSLLMADIRCLPGMEGGPVFGEHAQLVGILNRPLRQKNGGAEIQLVIPWEAIATACSDLLQKEPQNAEKEFHINKGNLNAVGNSSFYSHHDSNGSYYKYGHCSSCFPSPLPVQKAMASVCLITTDDGVWASGVLLNDQGLILTNAHLLEPWRFGKTTVSGGKYGNQSMEFIFASEEPAAITAKLVDSSVDQSRPYNLSSFFKGHRNIRVRLDHGEPWIWCDAKVVYVCKGPLDVALLQLEYVPDQLCPIVADFAHLSVGSTTYVIGHGLFGPRCGLSASVCCGVVAKVVKVKSPPYCQSILQGDSGCPVMLETTAAVHPGGSGGAVVNLDGHMIGLVTSNARHSGGTVIPHLNFSIPCAVLTPIFEFSRDMQDLSLLKKLDQPNEHLASVWALMPPLSPKPDPALPHLPQSLLEANKDGKGSRFAKFIAERQEVLKGSPHMGKVEKNASEISRSKL